MKISLLAVTAISVASILVGCTTGLKPEPAKATITVTFDLSGGGSGFSASVYVQEVSMGVTYSHPYDSGAHGLVILPTSAPIVFTVDAPGTYVVYANLVNAPESYHFGAVGCAPGANCVASELKAIDVSPGGTYSVYVSDRLAERHAPVPTPHAPVSVPWTR